MKKRARRSLGVTPGPNAKFVSVKQLADVLQVNPWTLRHLVYGRRIPFYRVGSVLRFNLNAVEQALLTKPVKPRKKKMKRASSSS